MKAKLRVEGFEEKVVPAVAIDAGYEAYAWVLINTLRQDPSAFADNLQGLINNTVNSAFGFAKTDPVIADLRAMKSGGSQSNYTAALDLMRGTMPRGPLAWDELLEDRAGDHNEWMKDHGFSHTGQTGGSALPGYSATAGAADTYGYSGQYSSWGENIGYGAGQFPNTKAAYNSGSVSLSGLQQRAAFLDTVGYMLELYSGSLGHLQNLLRSDVGSGSRFNVIGLDIDLYEAPGYEQMDGVPEAGVSTHRPALYRPNGTGGFVAGIVYADANGNDFYDAGEAANLTVDVRDAAGNGFTDTLTASDRGAFSEFLPNGTYTLTVSNGGATIATETLTINNSNAWAAVDAVAPDAPTKPVVNGPTGTQTTLQPTVTWGAVPSATSYQVRIDNLTTGQTNILPGSTTTNTAWAPTAGLVSGQSYRVTVRAVVGVTPGEWSDPVDFAIARPALTGPATGVANLRPAFTWIGITGAAYDVRLDDVTGKKNNLFPRTRVDGPTWTPPADLVSGRTYRWMVRAVNDNGVGTWTAAATFSVARPTVNFPADVATLRPTITWSAVTGAASYRIIVNYVTGAKNNLFPTARVTGTSWTPPADLVSGRTYQVTVRAMNAADVGAKSVPVTFVLARPTPNAPVGDLGDLTPTFDWTAIAGATSYRVRVDDLTTGKTNVQTATVAGLSWTPGTDLVAGHRYRWYVTALNDVGLGTKSAGQDFRIV
jgi:hypothetical protein